MRDLLRWEGHAIRRRHMSTLMTRMGIETVCRKSHTSQLHPVYPYLLRNVKITRSNHVWATDITYIPMHRGFVYLCAVLDWASRRVLAWLAVQHADDRFLYGGGPGGHDQLWRTEYLQHRSRISVHAPGVNEDPENVRHSDQHGRHRLLARQRVCGTALEEHQIRGGLSARLRDCQATQQGFERYLTSYNQTRQHRALDGQTPDGVYFDNLPTRRTAT